MLRVSTRFLSENSQGFLSRCVSGCVNRFQGLFRSRVCVIPPPPVEPGVLERLRRENCPKVVYGRVQREICERRDAASRGGAHVSTRELSLFEAMFPNAGCQSVALDEILTNPNPKEGFANAIRLYAGDDTRMFVIQLRLASYFDGFRSQESVNTELLSFCGGELREYRLDNHPAFPELMRRLDKITQNRASQVYRAI